ncbi:CD209 antigen-like protein E isoform X2 [Perca flavescens]|uniref:CD209 antigen-like protein E isoform X2 n=1 Tax=Perca flavescens TaxID=8167 RepID=UPI00106E066F|nr:CD209 antigen-like protein E isoform X2 [Perca flavescens]XP_028447638.1 CD209 antigen-like protein E isoform X2 [Perca flavescens]XP_028447639.1 CD209 antigen-like protein E isoform X2 [Perca flavescens]XP_028447640.1 CD209 antigen-like protein E isoform X2 [Perca flavescens]XP_028447641.1 CD209 antigen-like protein E isoform X2 [Perca flavescens]XP_028447642.1 CD209 antigen-like protein E isoform X2 [Perca flavescens]
MDDMYTNVEYDKSVNLKTSTNQTGPRSSERRFHGAVVLCLGLLSVFLLAGIIGLGVHYHVSLRGSAAELSSIKANLTERLQASDNKSSSLTEERDRLNSSLTEMAKELDRLKQKKTCPAGWRMFNSSYYLLSAESGSWEKGRQDCRERGADLVVIESSEEQMFLSEFITKNTWYWIGLTDRNEEGTWKWVDGTPLTLKNWRTEQPDNGRGDPQWGEEDCVQVGPTTAEWNDLSCEKVIYWICERHWCMF